MIYIVVGHMVLNRKGRAISWHKGIDGAYHQRHGAAEAEPVSIISLPNSIPQPSIQKSSLVREEFDSILSHLPENDKRKALAAQGLESYSQIHECDCFYLFRGSKSSLNPEYSIEFATT